MQKRLVPTPKTKQPETDAPVSRQQKPQNHPDGRTIEKARFPSLRKSLQQGQEDHKIHFPGTFSNNVSFYLPFFWIFSSSQSFTSLTFP